MAPRTIAIANHKGGTAKTTTTVNLAQALNDAGYATLVIDMDEQCNATRAVGARPDTGAPDMLSILMRESDIDTATVPTPGGVRLVPATQELGNVDPLFAKKPGLHGTLKAALSRMSGAYDFVLIDCPGSMGNLTMTALAACTEILVPVAAGSMELEAVRRFEQHISDSVELLNPNARIDHILVSRVELHQIADQDVVAALAEDYPGQLMRTVIPKSVRVTESYSAGQPVVTYAPTSRPAFAFTDAARELLERNPR